MIVAATLHIDTNGKKRLDTLLDNFSPETLAVEWPNIGIEETLGLIHDAREEREHMVENSGFPDNIKALLLYINSFLGYEAISAIEYSRRKNIQLYFTDDLKTASYFSEDNDFIDSFSYSLSNISNKDANIGDMDFELLLFAYNQIIDLCYYDTVLFNRLTKENKKKISDEELKFAEEREGYIVSRINSIRPDFYISGIGHVIEGYINFKVPLLKDRLDREVLQNIEIIRLCDVKV